MDTTANRYRHILSAYLPEAAVERVFCYLNLHRIHLHITRGRSTKLGDYRRPGPGHERHAISINGDLNPYLFPWVFLHEAAHLETHLHHPHAQPHGHEWQGEYARLLDEYAGLFPEEAQPLIHSYTSRIPLSRSVGRKIETLLLHHDPGYHPATTLDQQLPGVRFRLKNKPERLFEALEKRRTRWLCHCLDDGCQYLVSGTAEIEPEQTAQ